MGGKVQIKLVTYNIWHGTHLEKVIEFLRQERADIVCLQEAGTSGRGQKASEISIFDEIKAALGIPGVFKNTFWGSEGQGKYNLGNALLTQRPVVDEREFYYERKLTGKVLEGGGKDRYNLPRVLLGQKLVLGERELWVFTGHHTITPEGGVTEHQLAATREVKRFLGDFDEYILCGDMNTPYGNKNYKMLSEGLTDWSEPPTPTLHPTIHKVGYKGYHVDYVFAKGQGMKHLKTRIPVVAASDHLPVVVELEV